MKKKKKIPKAAERLRQYFAAIAIGVPVRPLFGNALIKQKSSGRNVLIKQKSSSRSHVKETIVLLRAK